MTRVPTLVRAPVDCKAAAEKVKTFDYKGSATSSIEYVKNYDYKGSAEAAVEQVKVLTPRAIEAVKTSATDAVEKAKAFDCKEAADKTKLAATKAKDSLKEVAEKTKAAAETASADVTPRCEGCVDHAKAQVRWPQPACVSRRRAAITAFCWRFHRQRTSHQRETAGAGRRVPRCVCRVDGGPRAHSPAWARRLGTGVRGPRSAHSAPLRAGPYTQPCTPRQTPRPAAPSPCRC